VAVVVAESFQDLVVLVVLEPPHLRILPAVLVVEVTLLVLLEHHTLEAVVVVGEHQEEAVVQAVKLLI
jgi:hypothetical protein